MNWGRHVQTKHSDAGAKIYAPVACLESEFDVPLQSQWIKGKQAKFIEKQSDGSLSENAFKNELTHSTVKEVGVNLVG